MLDTATLKENSRIAENENQGSSKAFMTRREMKLKERLIKLLQDDGHGHYHAKFAKRLANFNINIVPLDEDPDFTAAISFTTGIIYISEGFLNDPATFDQLNVLMRHEMSHNLLLHELRMSDKLKAKYGDAVSKKLKLSNILHNLENIIMDDEISNTRYTAEDKETVRHMMLNGKLIGGLVTEDHRPGWQEMSLEQMDDAISGEIKNLKKEIVAARNGDKKAEKALLSNKDDYITNNIINAYIYTDITSPSVIRIPLGSFINGNTFKNDFAKPYQDIVLAIYAKYKDNKDKIAPALSKIQDSGLSEPIAIDGIDLYTPEEKYLAVEALKNLKGNFEPVIKTYKKKEHSSAYIKAYNAAIDKYDDDKYSSSDLYAEIRKIEGQLKQQA